MTARDIWNKLVNERVVGLNGREMTSHPHGHDNVTD